MLLWACGNCEAARVCPTGTLVCKDGDTLLCPVQTKTEERYYQFREEELLNLHDDDSRGCVARPHTLELVYAEHDDQFRAFAGHCAVL